MQKGKTLLAVMAVSCALIGCGQGGESEISSVSINKDGTISHRIVGGFDRNYYDMDELKSMAADRVAEYCAGQGDGRVSLASVEEKEDKIYIQLNYASQEDYSDFNHREMFVGTLSEAFDQGYPLEAVPFVSADGEATEIGFMEEQDKAQIVIIAMKPSEELVVDTYGKVLYINQGEATGLDVSFSGKKGARISYPAAENADESELSYIIFE